MIYFQNVKPVSVAKICGNLGVVQIKTPNKDTATKKYTVCISLVSLAPTDKKTKIAKIMTINKNIIIIIIYNFLPI